MKVALLDQFDLVLIINLASRTDRRREVVAQLRSVGHEIGGKIQFLPAIQPGETQGFRSLGARGCFLSHLECLTKALADNTGSLLILEDDVDFTANYERLQVPVSRRLMADDWEMFYGGGNIGYRHTEDETARPLVDGVREVPCEVPIGLAHFVGIRGRRIAELHTYLVTMLQRPAGHPEGGPMDVDGAYVWFRREREVKTLIAEPQLAFQRSSASNITPRWFDQVPGLSLATGVMRTIKRSISR